MAFIGLGSRFEFDTSRWLYGDWNEEKLRKFQIAYAIPGVRDYMDYLLDRRADQEYLNRYGMDYTDIHDPRKLRTSGSYPRVVGSVYRMVSRNIDKLYK